MLKHIGRHGDRKVAILFREVPGEDHMCLVIYPETLPTHIHDSIMKTLESTVGQQANNFADALHRGILPDGRPQLEALHREGMLKKIRTEHVIMTPTTTSSVKLDELNRLVREMESGDEAARRMQQIDESAGLVSPERKRSAEAEFKSQRLSASVPLQATPESALDDRALAGNMLAQAKRMETEARGMIAEAARMKKEAETMHPGVTTAMAAEQKPADTAPRTRGRKKAVAADAVQ
jgi:hypothetical protein